MVFIRLINIYIPKLSLSPFNIFSVAYRENIGIKMTMWVAIAEYICLFHSLYRLPDTVSVCAYEMGRKRVLEVYTYASTLR